MLPRLRIACLLIACLGWGGVRAQDPFFTHFSVGESAFNPALTGYRGAASFGFKAKRQWHPASGQVPGYLTGLALYEESLPCSIFDYGLSAMTDYEGQGYLRTTQFGAQLAGTVPFGNKSYHNLRLGASMQWAQKRIDYGRLTFSDQLDPKYGTVDVFGIPLPTAFEAPASWSSLWFFSPSVGFSYRVLIARKRAKKNEQRPTLHVGAALHNAFGLGKDKWWGQEESLLQIGTKIPARLTGFATYEMIPYAERRDFVSLKLAFFYQQQANLQMFTGGIKAGLNRTLAAGLYLQYRDAPQDGVATNWLTVTLDTGIFTSDKSRLDIGLAYSSNLSGLNNALGDLMEASVLYSFGTSRMCAWAGQDYDLTEDAVDCPTSKLTRQKRKLYENIWFR